MTNIVINLLVMLVLMFIVNTNSVSLLLKVDWNNRRCMWRDLAVTMWLCFSSTSLATRLIWAGTPLKNSLIPCRLKSSIKCFRWSCRRTMTVSQALVLLAAYVYNNKNSLTSRREPLCVLFRNVIKRKSHKKLSNCYFSNVTLSLSGINFLIKLSPLFLFWPWMTMNFLKQTFKVTCIYIYWIVCYCHMLL